jgi:hypothetical protein
MKSILIYIALLFVESIAVAGVIFAIYFYYVKTKYNISIEYIDMVYVVFSIKIITTNFIAFISAVNDIEPEQVDTKQ